MVVLDLSYLNYPSNARFKDVMQAIDIEDWTHQDILPDEENRFPPVRETAQNLYDLGLTDSYISENVRANVVYAND